MKILTLILIATVFVFNTAAQQSDKTYTDGRIGIILDLLERTDNYPSELKSPGERSPILKEGHNWVVVYFTIETINNIHIVSFGGRDAEKSIIYDDRGETHKLYTWSSDGWKFVDPDKGLTGPGEFPQGSKVIIVFEFPENENPKELSFVYYYIETWDDEHNQKGKFNILIEPTS